MDHSLWDTVLMSILKNLMFYLIGTRDFYFTLEWIFPMCVLHFSKNWLTVWVRIAMNSWILDPARCTIFTMPSRLKGVKFWYWSIAVDIHFLFELYFPRRDDYDATEVTSHLAKYALKHYSTRWTTMKKNALHLLEKWANLEEHFRTFPPKQHNFKPEIQ